jgi:hypothetical protein
MLLMRAETVADGDLLLHLVLKRRCEEVAEQRPHRNYEDQLLVIEQEEHLDCHSTSLAWVDLSATLSTGSPLSRSILFPEEQKSYVGVLKLHANLAAFWCSLLTQLVLFRGADETLKKTLKVKVPRSCYV